MATEMLPAPTRGHRRRRRSVSHVRALLVVFAGMAVIATACTTNPPVNDTAVPEFYRVSPGIEQIYVQDAGVGDHILVTHSAQKVREGVADEFGSLVIRGLSQGETYRVENLTSGEASDVRVLVADEHPPRSFYDSTSMKQGLNYVPMRDGTTIAATVRPPIGQSLSDGPFPTVVEYSGYQIAAPSDPMTSKVGTLLGLDPDPLAPAGSTDVGGLLVRLGGYAVVQVQMRGSGCSGGESDLFDLNTNHDGYDIIETVAAQGWVSHGMVGMVGISFSGISQIATAATKPPHLAAIAPLSFLGSLYDVAYPGGVYNTGFARTWLQERMDNAQPAPHPDALEYANLMVDTDNECRANQMLRLQTLDAVGLTVSTDTFADHYRRRDLRPWMSEIDVPTFASLQFEDEETSSYAMLNAQDLLDSNSRVWLNISNGHHRDAVTPDTITQLFEFLDIYVARRAPEPKLAVIALSDMIFGTGSAFPPLPEAMAPTLWEARALLEARPRVRYLIDLTSGSNEGKNPGVRWDFMSDSFPPVGSVEQTWFLGADGVLADSPSADASDSYTALPTERFPDEDEEFNWTQVSSGAGLGYVSEPLTDAVVAIGAAAAETHLSSSAADTDLAITLTEVRPDGQEMLVGKGVQRASMRTIDPARSTPTQPYFTLDAHLDLDPGTNRVDVQLLPLGHVFRAGSRIRVEISAVNGDFERWAFASVDPAEGSTMTAIHTGLGAPSSITLTTLDRDDYPSELLPCPAAGKPCRAYSPATNGG